jgi:hypothetical protein
VPYYGYTGNAITDQSLRWSMPNVLPDPPGLEIDNVIYSYRIQKETGEHVDVYVYNKNADGTGYIFREHDEWKPGSLAGTQINKVVPLGRLHRDLFGDGGIDVEGNGSIYDPNVIYTYRVDPCYDPQFDPNCPGYQTPQVDVPEIDYASLYSVMDDENVDLDRSTDPEYQNEENLDENEKKKKEEEEELKRKYRLEKALSATDAAALFAEDQRIQVMNMVANQNAQPYYKAALSSGVYNDTIVLQDAQLPDSKSGLRNGFAQQLLHQQMVEMQYKNEE